MRFAPGPIPRDEPARVVKPPPEPTAEQEALAATIAAPLEDENLRESVQKAALFSLLRQAGGGPL